MQETWADWDDWDEDVDPYAYFTGYIAMNHPEPTSDLGYNFVGYDFNPGYFSEIDMDLCAERVIDAEGTTEEVCGGLVVDDEDMLVPGNHNIDVGSRRGYFTSWAWWYEDFPNLDLDIMGEGFDWLYEG
jgi:hypothetical protein